MKTYKDMITEFGIVPGVNLSKIAKKTKKLMDRKKEKAAKKRAQESERNAKKRETN